MKKTVLVLIILIFIFGPCKRAMGYERIRVSEDIEIIKLSKNAYVHVSVSEMPPFGNVSSNGLIYIIDKEAFLFDTPITERQTAVLIKYIS